MIDFTCPQCKKTLKIPEEYLGQWGTCTHCKGRICVIVEPVESSPAVIEAEEEKQESTKEERVFQSYREFQISEEAKAAEVAEKRLSDPATPGQDTQVIHSVINSCACLREGTHVYWVFRHGDAQSFSPLCITLH